MTYYVHVDKYTHTRVFRRNLGRDLAAWHFSHSTGTVVTRVIGGNEKRTENNTVVLFCNGLTDTPHLTSSEEPT